MSEERYRVRWIGGAGGWYVQDHKGGVHTKCRCDLREDADEIAAALNASAQRDAERKLSDDLLREARSIIADCSMQRLRREGWLMRYAALQAEVSDG